MSQKKITPNSHPEAVFPFTQNFGGLEYRQSLINPSLIKNATEPKAKEIMGQLKHEGWMAEMVSFDTPIGKSFLVYERKR